MDDITAIDVIDDIDDIDDHTQLTGVLNWPSAKNMANFVADRDL